jgi:hypothetical protein
MNRVFEGQRPFRVPDGTLVAPFLNPSDSLSGFHSKTALGFSLAAGRIEAGCRSRIQFMPFVTMVTFVTRGRLLAIMKGPQDAVPYQLDIGPEQAVLTEATLLLQLINDTDHDCTVLYIVCPAYVFEKVGERVVFDDAVVAEETWDQLRDRGWRSRTQAPTRAERDAAEARIRHVGSKAAESAGEQ